MSLRHLCPGIPVGGVSVPSAVSFSLSLSQTASRVRAWGRVGSLKLAFLRGFSSVLLLLLPGGSSYLGTIKSSLRMYPQLYDRALMDTNNNYGGGRYVLGDTVRWSTLHEKNSSLLKGWSRCMKTHCWCV